MRGACSVVHLLLLLLLHRPCCTVGLLGALRLLLLCADHSSSMGLHTARLPAIGAGPQAALALPRARCC